MDVDPRTEDIPCEWCWEGRADQETARNLIVLVDEELAAGEAALAAAGYPLTFGAWAKAKRDEDPLAQAAGERAQLGEIVAEAALDRLRRIVDPRAAQALREATAHARPRVRSAAILSLGWSGERRDVDLVLPRLADESRDVRSAAVGALAEFGGTRAADALASRFDALSGDELAEHVAASVWLRDPRGFAEARVRAPEALREDERRVVHALVRAGHADDLDLLRGLVLDEVGRTGELGQSYRLLAWALEVAGRDRRRALDDWLLEQGVEQARWRADDPSPVAIGTRSVPRLALETLMRAPEPGDWPPAKFGGQPDWLDAPAWPIAGDGRPLTFYGQLPLGGQSRRMAYVFINCSHYVDTWLPLADGNAVVVQPGGAPHARFLDLRRGPQLFEPVVDRSMYRAPFGRHEAYERFIRLQTGADPVEWPLLGSNLHGDWNKVGGTPLWLQAAESPPGDGWEFAFQFSAAWAGRELADGAQCYGFVREDGTAALSWQCH